MSKRLLTGSWGNSAHASQSLMRHDWEEISRYEDLCLRELDRTQSR